MKVHMMKRINSIGYTINNCYICNKPELNLHPVNKRRDAAMICTACMKAKGSK
jgi:hypothetical protein